MSQRTAEPKTIGDYDLLAQVGEGGAGVVYKARHRVSEAIVAVKVLHAQQARSRTLLKRFEQEFRAARPLRHPHLVRAFDFQQLDGTAFLVMEFIEGRSLGERLELAGRIPISEAIALVSQVARALDWLHGQGILHRDVKPDNIIVSIDGVAKLTDLGLVKELLMNQNLTRTGAALGTPHFMAPEQFRDAKRVDKRCDVYSLAATLYQLVTGEIPFQTSGPFEAWVKKTKNEFVAPRELMPEIPEQIDRAICRAMNGDPDQRPGTCGEFIEDLTRGLPLVPKADLWELVYDEKDRQNDPLQTDTATIRQLLSSGQLSGARRVLARRLGGSFESLGNYSEFCDLMPPKRAVDDGKKEVATAQKVEPMLRNESRLVEDATKQIFLAILLGVGVFLVAALFMVRQA